MIEDRKIAFDNISRTFAITRYDIEQHQLVNDQSLNIHGENWFRDIFNFVYEKNFINANFETKTGNSSAIDLIDKENKIAYQITTTRTKEKVSDCLTKFAKTSYKEYVIKIFFLLDKSNFNQKTKKYFKDIHNINEIEEYLLDYTDLIKTIESLETNKLIELNKQLFLNTADKYTDVIVLNLIFKHLLKEKKTIIVDYEDNDFGTVDTTTKLNINEINEKISAKIKESLDYRVVLDNFYHEDNVLTDLKSHIIDKLYKNILLEKLKLKVSEKKLLNKKTSELQNIATAHKIDFNKIITILHKEIENSIEVDDWNSMGIAWVIIAYFFELCDVGVDEIC